MSGGIQDGWPGPKTLTKDALLAMEPGKVFAKGEAMDVRLHRAPIRWVAVRGHGDGDWALYYHLRDWSYAEIRASGDKAFTKEAIFDLVNFDEDAWQLYRT
jgi:hypothetical protein